jgi:membrane protein DedA with SNARE-associated domain
MPDLSLINWLLIAFASLATAAVGNPVPEEMLIIGWGVWTATHAEEYGAWRWLMLPTVIAGAVVADVMLYGVGRVFGARLLEHRWVAKLAPPAKIERIRFNFHAYGVWVLIIGRLIPGIRTALFLTSGIIRLSVPRFLLADLVGALLGNGLFFLLAFLFGNQFKELLEAIKREAIHRVFQPATVLLVLLLVGLYFLIRFMYKPIPTGDPEELPLIGHQVAVHINPCTDPPPETITTAPGTAADAAAADGAANGLPAQSPGQPAGAQPAGEPPGSSRRG